MGLQRMRQLLFEEEEVVAAAVAVAGKVKQTFVVGAIASRGCVSIVIIAISAWPRSDISNW